MFVYCVTIYIKPEYRQAFIEATLENARNTRKEYGNIRFDVLECLDDLNRFFLYEVYRDEKDVNTHKETHHYNKWRTVVAEMMAKPREGVKHKNLFPETEKGFKSL